MNANGPLVARLQTVTHRYGKTLALDAVTLDLPSGSMMGLIGPDGVGKSTLLALVAGARKIQSGRVEVLGGDMASRRYRNRVCPRIAYMPQGLGKNLYMDLTVFENLEFFGRLFGQDRAARRRRIAELLKSTGLDPFPDRPAGKLSSFPDGNSRKNSTVSRYRGDPAFLLSGPEPNWNAVRYPGC